MALTNIIQRVRSRTSLERLRSNSSSSRVSLERKHSSGSRTSIASSTQTVLPAILRENAVTSKILDVLVDAPGGKRIVSKLARTCKAFFDPAADALWKDLDSLVPLIGLFPAHLLRRSKRPGLGLAKIPEDEDWDRLLAYGERVQNMTYHESMYNVSPSIFPVIDEYRPRLFILPNLKTLVWRCETSAGLERSMLFLNPDLETLVLDIGMRLPNFATFVAELPNRVKLHKLSISSVTPLPDNFAEAMTDQINIEDLSLNVPGSLSSSMGRWISSLPRLKKLHLVLAPRPFSSVDAFFEGTGLRSGCSTPSSMGATDSGVFSGGEEPDLAEFRRDLRKSALRVTGDYPMESICPGGAFQQLADLHLVGDAGTIAEFVRHLHGNIVDLELTIDDPPVGRTWQDLCSSLDTVAGSLQNLSITATGASRPDVTRPNARSEAPVVSRALSLKELPTLPHLRKLDIDLPQSVIFEDADVLHVSTACPAIEVLKLCPTARFPLSAGHPKLTMEGLAHVTCRSAALHTLSVVIVAVPGSELVLGSRDFSSSSLVRLNLGHSWVKDPLQAAILLSHLAPRLQHINFNHDAARPGYIAAHANGWQQVANLLPHLQRMRDVERKCAQEAVDNALLEARFERAENEMTAEPAPFFVSKLESIKEDIYEDSESEGEQGSVDEDLTLVLKPQMVDKSIDATICIVDEGVQAGPLLVDMSISPIEERVSLPPSPRSVISAVTADAAVQTSEEASTQATIEAPPSVEVKADPVDSTAKVDISTDLVGFVEIPNHTPRPTPTFCEDSATRPAAPGGGVFSLVRDACVTVPLYVSLVVFKSTLSMMGARNPVTSTTLSPNRRASASERFVPASMNFSPVCM